MGCTLQRDRARRKRTIVALALGNGMERGVG